MILEGGCLCGAVRYRASAEPVLVSLCHCPTCRRSAGAPAVAWATFAAASLEIVRGTLAVHASSKGVERRFCGACGTSLTYNADMLQGFVDVTVASLDDPASMPIQMHIWEEHRLPWLRSDDSLPRHPGFPPFGDA